MEQTKANHLLYIHIGYSQFWLWTTQVFSKHLQKIPLHVHWSNAPPPNCCHLNCHLKPLIKNEKKINFWVHSEWLSTTNNSVVINTTLKWILAEYEPKGMVGGGAYLLAKPPPGGRLGMSSADRYLITVTRSGIPSSADSDSISETTTTHCTCISVLDKKFAKYKN